MSKVVVCGRRDGFVFYPPQQTSCAALAALVVMENLSARGRAFCSGTIIIVSVDCRAARGVMGRNYLRSARVVAEGWRGVCSPLARVNRRLRVPL